MLTHTTNDKIHYAIKLHGADIATATRQKGEWRTTSGEIETARSMAELKRKILAKLPAELKALAETKPITIPDALARFGMSHTAAYVYSREIRATWPEWTKDQHGPYLLRKLHEANASWPGICADQSKRWLAANPDVGPYDETEEARRTAALYPTQTY